MECDEVVVVSDETAKTLGVEPRRQRVELELEEVAAQRPPDDARRRVHLLYDVSRASHERRHTAHGVQEETRGEGHVLPFGIDRGALLPASGRRKHG